MYQFDVIESFIEILGYERMYGKSFSEDPDIRRDPIFTVKNAEKVLSYMDVDSTKYRKDVIQIARDRCLRNHVVIEGKLDDVSRITHPMMIHFICVGTVQMVEDSKYYDELRYNVFNTSQQDQLKQNIKKAFDKFDIFSREQAFSLLLMKIDQEKNDSRKMNKDYVEPSKEKLARRHVAAVFKVREHFGIFLNEECRNIHYIDYITSSPDPAAVICVHMNTLLYHKFMEDPMDFYLIEILSVLKLIGKFMIEYKQEIRTKILTSRELSLSK